MEIINTYGNYELQRASTATKHLPTLSTLLIVRRGVFFFFCWQHVEVEQWRSNGGGDRERNIERERELDVKYFWV